jgi:hypothetical protein
MRLTVSAGLTALDGDRVNAAERFRLALGAWRALDCKLPLGLALLDFATLLGHEDSDPAVRTEARAIFTALGATPLLARLEQAAEATE